jgi:hypothetical protein
LKQIEVVESELLLITNAILNIIPIEVDKDTACSQSVIPQTFVTEHKIQTFPSALT